MSSFPDWQPAPNIRDAPALYELENEALDPEDRVLAKLRELGDWRAGSIVDLGCGTGYWLLRYAREAAVVTGVEPDPDLLALAAERADLPANVNLVHGSAEHLPLAPASVDVVHARFAYFWGPGAEAGLQEVARVLRPGGVLVVVDNDYSTGEFAGLLRAAAQESPGRDPGLVNAWWARHGGDRSTVLSEWRFTSRQDMVSVLDNEFRDGSAQPWLRRHPDRLHITYSFALFRWRR